MVRSTVSLEGEVDRRLALGAKQLQQLRRVLEPVGWLKGGVAQCHVECAVKPRVASCVGDDHLKVDADGERACSAAVVVKCEQPGRVDIDEHWTERLDAA